MWHRFQKVRARLRHQPDCTSSVAAFNQWFVRSCESHLSGPPVSCAKCFALLWPPLHFHKIHRRRPRRTMISSLAQRKDLAPVPWRSSTLLCWVFSTCASSSPLEADVLCVARITRLARPTCRASAFPLEETRDVFRVLQQLPQKPKVQRVNKDPRRPHKAPQRVRRSRQGAMVVRRVSKCALWCQCRLRVMPVWLCCACGICLVLFCAFCACYALYAS